MKLADCYPCDNIESYNVWIDGKQVSSGTSRSKNEHDNPAEFKVHFGDTKAHEFRMEYSHESPLFGAGVSFDWQPPVDTLRQQAVETAKQADAVVAFVGISPRLEGEEMPIHIPGFSGGDRTSIDLPDVQVKMLQAVAATGKPLIVVLMNGSALAVNWSAQHANAILEAWYPGARGGQAIIDTLLGKNNPAGRLPITFYSSTSELPPFTDYSMADRTYRYFHGATLYGFGYGLSYSQFKFDKLQCLDGETEGGRPSYGECRRHQHIQGRWGRSGGVVSYLPENQDQPNSCARWIFARACGRWSYRACANQSGRAAMEPGAGEWRSRDSAGKLYAVRRR